MPLTTIGPFTLAVLLVRPGALETLILSMERAWCRSRYFNDANSPSEDLRHLPRVDLQSRTASNHGD